MKTIKLYFAMIASILMLSNTAFSQEGWVLKATASNINSVFFINPALGWMVGDSGMVYTSDDGGMSWSGLDSKTTNKLNSVFFKNEFTGWAAGMNGTIIKTTDGGDNWTVLPSGTTENLVTVNFPTLDTGFVSSYTGGHTFRTLNGGTTWSLFGSGWNNILFVNALTGFGTYPTADLGRTTNGGLAWSVTPPYPSNGYGIHFSTVNTGWVSATGGFVYKTTNMGDNWVTQPTGLGISCILYGINFSDVSSGWSVGSIGTTGGSSEIIRTTNGGTNWIIQSSGTTNILRSTSALTGSEGIAVGDAGTLLRTSNGGTNWNNKLHTFISPSHPNYHLTSTFFINENTGWAASQLGLVNRTTNGGDNWTSASTTSFNQINSVHFLDNDTGWVAGNGGTIQITNNSGANWISQSLPVSNNLNDINIGKYSLTGFFGLYRIGWCVGNGGVIFKTTNGGTNWVAQLSPTMADLHSVVPFSENVAIACGDSGRIIKTTNGGLFWEVSVSGAVRGSLRALSFADNDNGICVGDSATVLYTTNQGDAWLLDITGPRGLTTKNLLGVSARMDIMMTYIAIGEEGVILKSDDAGGSWTKLLSGIKSKFNGISTPSDNTSYVVGTRGTILKTVDGGALPVELASFSYSLNNNNVNLYWRTVTEINNSGFEIERSMDNGQWSMVGSVRGFGNSTSVHNYSFEDRDLASGKYKYRLKQIDFNGNFEYYNLNSEIVIGSPEKFELSQNYPNPFNPSTIIRYSLHENSLITLKVYDVLGKEVAVLVNEKQIAGSYDYQLSTINYQLSSGIYFYTLVAGDFKKTMRMMVIK